LVLLLLLEQQVAANPYAGFAMAAGSGVDQQAANSRKIKKRWQ
jgi:hypothetical protein